LMRPSKSVLDLSVSSVKKKFKQKSFAQGVNRDIITEGAAMLNMDLDEVIYQTIEGMKKVADKIGLRGSL
jgi:predicted hydrolase (HD superfamily)